MVSSPTDDELLAAWADGDSQAGAALLERHFSSVFRFFRSKLDGSVDDLVQRTYEACLASRSAFRGQSSFRAWLLGIARIQLLRYLQRELPRGSRPLDPMRSTVRQALTTASPSAVVAAREEHRVLLEAMRNIPLDLQIVLELHYWEDLSVREICTTLGVPSGTVKTRLKRARERLHEAMAGVPARPEVRTSIGADLDRWVQGLRAEIEGEDPSR